MQNCNKKKYSRPEVTTHSIDNEISLVMMTHLEPNPPGPPGTTQAAQESPTEVNNFESNPFGE